MANPKTPIEIVHSIIKLRKKGLSFLKIAAAITKSGFKITDAGCHRALAKYEKGSYDKKEVPLSIEEEIKADIELSRDKQTRSDTSTKYKKLQEVVDELNTTLEAIANFRSHHKVTAIKAPAAKEQTESTPVLMLSDVHFEETVVGNTINGLNEYNIVIAKSRLEKYFTSALKLIDHFSNETKIKNIVLRLGGDFITGQIHDELKEENGLTPMEALRQVKSILRGGIEYMIKNSDYTLNIVTSFGNHGRNTKQMTHGDNARKHSFEYYMYLDLMDNFKDEKRVKRQIGKGYFSYLDIYGQTLRFHHGHYVKYGGGVGGLYIPVNKAIAMRNRAKHADIDIFGHYHQLIDGGNFICNGSVIGYGPYAMSIKAAAERAQQGLFLMNSKYGKTISAPLILS